MHFLPIAILGYGLNGISAIIDKILLKTSFSSPFVYTFYICVLGIITVLLIPFGVQFNPLVLIIGTISGFVNVIALICFFEALKRVEASVVTPIVGSLNPYFSLILGMLFFNQLITPTQLIAFFVLVLGAVILSINLWLTRLKFNEEFLLMVASGFFYAITFLLLKESFNASNFITGLIVNRLSAAVIVLFFLFIPNIRVQILSRKGNFGNVLSRSTILFFIGQTMGATSAMLLAFGVSLANPALVNSLFGVQYLVILVGALILSRASPRLLEEKLTGWNLVQKIMGVILLSIGVYLLSK